MLRDVVLSQTIRRTVIVHALEVLPDECCGILVGKGAVIERAEPMRSIMPSPDAYVMDPLQQIEVFARMREQGESLLGIYHSHPGGPPEPSGADVQMAFHPEAAYIIVSLDKDAMTKMRAYRLTDGGFKEVPLTFV